ncbi:unnamed protein product [Nezara viridula]|uniref:Uncharacterized protein n=1 Tax=Nezara viridula TaxID=85310 RepID=A0A9P0MZK3_NEZVI|nr:unnamed protein product [Nezara viridula]
MTSENTTTDTPIPDIPAPDSPTPVAYVPDPHSRDLHEPGTPKVTKTITADGREMICTEVETSSEGGRTPEGKKSPGVDKLKKITLSTCPPDPRFQQQNKTKWCYRMFIDFHSILELSNISRMKKEIKEYFNEKLEEMSAEESKPKEKKNLVAAGGIICYEEEKVEKTATVLSTCPPDPRFQQPNKTKWCYRMFIDFQRCSHLLGEDSGHCKIFKKCYECLCPNQWVRDWYEQIEDGTFPRDLEQDMG